MALVITFPNCRPIHLDVVAESMQERYEQENHFHRPFSLLFSYIHDHGIFDEMVSKSLISDIATPEELSIAEKIAMVKSFKDKIDWSKQAEYIKIMKDKYTNTPIGDLF
jgi:hypothetical protein